MAAAMYTPFPPGHRVDGEYIYFINVGRPPTRLTDTWHVCDKAAMRLGHIAWHGAWRKYCFYPDGATVFEETCLREIAEFIVKLTREYREMKRTHGK